MVEIVVHVPDPDAWDPVFLAGDLPELGRWQSRGRRLDRHDDGTHHTTLDIPSGHRIRFLATHGHWRAAEVDRNGLDLWPREFFTHAGQRHEIHVQRWGRNTVRYHHNAYSDFLPHPRTISVFLPPGYDHDHGRKYPVLYMHDGQNLFDAHTAFAGVPWRCDETAEQVIRLGEVEPLLIVGIANTPDRIREYGPRRAGPDGSDDLSRNYARMIIEEVKPYIDANYRTRTGPESTGVGGASMGGLISLHLCKWYPEVFGKCLAMSPSLWWEREFFLRSIRRDKGWLNHCKIWLDMGGREGISPTSMNANLQRARRLARQLDRHAPQDSHRFRADEQAGHNEIAWGGRFGDALRFLYPKG